MKLMIDIPEYVYKHIREGSQDRNDESIVCEAIAADTLRPLNQISDLNNDMVLKNIRTEYFRTCHQHNTGVIDNEEFVRILG